jgi:uncharacterized membrane protein
VSSPDWQRFVTAIVAISFAIGLVFIIHRLVHGEHEIKARRVFLALEGSAVTLLLASYLLGEVLKITNFVMGTPEKLELDLRWQNVAIVLGTIATSISLYVAAMWFLKQINKDD